MSDAVIFVLEPKIKELVLKSLSKGLRLPRPEDPLGDYERVANLYERRIYPNVDGIRLTIRLLGPGNEKIAL